METSEEKLYDRPFTERMRLIARSVAAVGLPFCAYLTWHVYTGDAPKVVVLPLIAFLQIVFCAIALKLFFRDVVLIGGDSPKELKNVIRECALYFVIGSLLLILTFKPTNQVSLPRAFFEEGIKAAEKDILKGEFNSITYGGRSGRIAGDLGTRVAVRTLYT